MVGFSAYLKGLAAMGELRSTLDRGVSGAVRLARNLWRMTAALFIAANALFLGQPQVLPKALHGWLSLPNLLILRLLLNRLSHVGYRALRRRAQAQVLAVPPP